MVNVYKVESHWSRELIIAKTIPEAIAKYEKNNKKIPAEDREIQKVELLGEGRF